ncbi:High-affinity glucose transporter [Fusarium oxysporum f. sp. albedinis]|nr:High-affinity glucose transporter [Fusarium oxysporum f. sp. albedinis]
MDGSWAMSPLPSGQAIQPALAQFQHKPCPPIPNFWPRRCNYRLSHAAPGPQLCSNSTTSLLSSGLAPLFLMHILLPTLQRRHNHPNTDQDLSAYRSFYRRCRSNENPPPFIVVIRTASPKP